MEQEEFQPNQEQEEGQPNQEQEEVQQNQEQEEIQPNLQIPFFYVTPSMNAGRVLTCSLNRARCMDEATLKCLKRTCTICSQVFSCEIHMIWHLLQRHFSRIKGNPFCFRCNGLRAIGSASKDDHDVVIKQNLKLYPTIEFVEKGYTTQVVHDRVAILRQSNDRETRIIPTKFDLLNLEYKAPNSETFSGIIAAYEKLAFDRQKELILEEQALKKKKQEKSSKKGKEKESSTIELPSEFIVIDSHESTAGATLEAESQQEKQVQQIRRKTHLVGNDNTDFAIGATEAAAIDPLLVPEQVLLIKEESQPQPATSMATQVQALAADDRVRTGSRFNPDAPIFVPRLDSNPRLYNAPIVVPPVERVPQLYDAPIVVPPVEPVPQLYNAPIVVPPVEPVPQLYNAPIIIPPVEPVPHLYNAPIVVEPVPQLYRVPQLYCDPQLYHISYPYLHMDIIHYLLDD